MTNKSAQLLRTTILLLVLHLSLGKEADVDYNDYGVYEYSIPYENSIEDYSGISSPSSGKEIKQMDVSKVKKPNQIRLSYTEDATEMAITWTTNSVTHHEVVNYGLVEADLNYTAVSISHQFKWHWDAEKGGFVYHSGFIHECLMVNLVPGRIHFYQVRKPS